MGHLSPALLWTIAMRHNDSLLSIIPHVWFRRLGVWLGREVMILGNTGIGWYSTNTQRRRTDRNMNSSEGPAKWQRYVCRKISLLTAQVDFIWIGIVAITKPIPGMNHVEADIIWRMWTIMIAFFKAAPDDGGRVNKGLGRTTDGSCWTLIRIAPWINIALSTRIGFNTCSAGQTSGTWILEAHSDSLRRVRLPKVMIGLWIVLAACDVVNTRHLEYLFPFIYYQDVHSFVIQLTERRAIGRPQETIIIYNESNK